MRLKLLFAALIAVLFVGAPASAEETLEERRARIEQMDSDQKDQLLQNYQRFVRLDEAERERLRKLHDDLETAADQTELRNTLQRYNDWLNDLPADQRAEIRSAPPEERLKKIEELRSAQKKQESFRLGSADVDAMRNWIQVNKLDVKLRALVREGGEKPAISPEQLTELRTALSEDGRAKLDAAIAEDAKHKGSNKWPHRSVSRLLLTWAGQTYPRRGMAGWGGGSPGSPGGGQRSGFRRPSEAELQTFLKNDLSEQERADLLNLPHEEMQVMLRRLWGMREFRRYEERQRAAGFGDRPADGQGPPGPHAPPGGPGDDRRPRGPGEKSRNDRPRRPADGPPPQKAPPEKPADEAKRPEETKP